MEESSTDDQKCYGPYDLTMATSMKTLLKNRLCILLNFFRQITLLLKRREFWLELKRGDSTQFQTEVVEFITLPKLSFPSLK